MLKLLSLQRGSTVEAVQPLQSFNRRGTTELRGPCTPLILKPCSTPPPLSTAFIHWRPMLSLLLNPIFPFHSASYTRYKLHATLTSHAAHHFHLRMALHHRRQRRSHGGPGGAKAYQELGPQCEILRERNCSAIDLSFMF